MTTCGRCSVADEKLKLAACVGCERMVCPKCQAKKGSDYRNFKDEDGFACEDCLLDGKVYLGGMMDPPREFFAKVRGILVPEIGKAVDARLDRIREEIIPPLVDHALARVEKLTGSTLTKAEQTVDRLVGRLEAAIGNQRTGARNDVDVVLKQVQANLHRTLMWVAIIIGLINLVGIVTAVFAANAFR